MNTLRVKNIYNEHGGARLKLVVFIIVFGVIIYAGYLYIPVAVDAYYFKDVMQNMVNQAAAQGSPSAWVKDQLVKMGIDASRLSTKGFGDSKPISDNTSLEGKANNRRVEFVKM